MERWNQEHPDKAVQPGDRFAEAGHPGTLLGPLNRQSPGSLYRAVFREVNGNTEGLAAECRKQQELRITVYRAATA